MAAGATIRKEGMMPWPELVIVVGLGVLRKNEADVNEDITVASSLIRTIFFACLILSLLVLMVVAFVA